MKRTVKVEAHEGRNMIQVDFKTPDFKHLSHSTIEAMENTEGVEQVFAATHTNSEPYCIKLVKGELYSYAEMIPRIENIVRTAIFNQTLLERASETIPVPNNTNDFLLWMGTATAIGYLITLITGG